MTTAKRVLPASLTEDLRALARACGVTLSVLVQGALVLAMARVTRQQDVVFGAVVSGRPADLPGVESILGNFVNNLPVRVRLPMDGTLRDWLKAMHAEQFRRSRFEYVSLVDLQNWADVPAGEPLFDTLLVWLSSSESPAPAGLRLRGLAGDVSTAYPLTLSVSETEDCVTLVLALKPAHALVDAGSNLLETLISKLGAMTDAGEDGVVGELGVATSDLAAPAVASANGENCTYRSGFHDPAVDAAVTASGRESLDTEALIDMLRVEWRALLDCDQIGLDDDFFAIGGDSLLAARLHAAIEISTRQAVPLITLFQGPTIRQMATILGERGWPLKPDTVIPVRPRGSLPPLFCVASPDVNTLGYAQLTRHLPGEQPVFVLQSPPDTESVRRLDPGELPAVAADYLEAMRKVQPEGPYYLLGMCTGAHLALEIARQLGGSDRQIAFLGIVNTWAFYTVSKLYHLARLLNRWRYYRSRIVDLVQRPAREQIAIVKAVAQRRVRSLRPAVAPAPAGAATGQVPLSSQSIPPRSEAAWSGDPWIDGVGWARKRGDIARFRGSLTVFRIRRQQFWRIRDASLGWGRFAEQARVEHLPGREHDLILREPHVRVVAERLVGLLNDAREKHKLTKRAMVGDAELEGCGDGPA